MAGSGRAARFSRPVSIALANDGSTIVVADTGNRRVRLITRDGLVTTVGGLSSRSAADSDGTLAPSAAEDEIEFDEPQSVSIDGLGNSYVVDKSGVSIVTRAPGSRTLSVRTRGGVTPRAFGITAKPFWELAVGEITTIAGGIPFLGDGGAASSARLTLPSRVTLDGAGNLFITNQVSVTVNGVVSNTFMFNL